MSGLLARVRKAWHNLTVPVKFCTWCDRQRGEHLASGRCVLPDCECRGCR